MPRATEYQVYAVRYAERGALRREIFLNPPPGTDPHDAPMPLDYFVWALVGPEKTWIVDAGFSQKDADRRQRTLLRSVTDGLGAIGVDAATAEDVIVSHLHYDHIGGFAKFPGAKFHIQET